MNKFFKKDILDVDILVHGEIHTDGTPNHDYTVRLAFGGLLDILKEQIERNNGKFEWKVVVRSLIQNFNNGDVYVYCSCPDFHYRQAYWLSVKDIIIGTKETRPSDITNPKDTLGGVCKHICLVLQNLQWIYKVASVINNYTNYMESHYPQAYRNVIYPTLYGKEYEGDKVNLKDDELGSDTELVKRASEYGKTRGQFQKGNTQGIRFAKETGEPVIDDDV